MADCRYLTDYPALSRHRREQADAKRKRNRRLVVAAPAAATVGLAAAAASPPLALFVGVIAAGVLFFLALPQASTVSAGELAGVEGEVAALRRLQALPDSFTIFNRLQVPDIELPNGRRELDFIISGPSGIWVVEVKNTPGLIHVQPEARHWPLARRAGCGSRPSWNAIDNPVPQVRAQVRALRRWLLQQGISAEPGGIVCFSHPEAAVRNADASPVPVLVRDQLEDFIGRRQRSQAGASAADTLAILAGSRSALSGGKARAV